MWNDKKEYKKLLNKKQSFEESMRQKNVLLKGFIERNKILMNENMRLKEEVEQLKEEVEQLKVKYADEVNKNFNLASYLSENKSI